MRMGAEANVQVVPPRLPVDPELRQQALEAQGSNVKLELSKTVITDHAAEDEPFRTHKPTPCSRLKLVLWFAAAALVIGAVVGLSVAMVIVQNNRENAPSPSLGPPAPPGAVAPPPLPGASSSSNSDDGPSGDSSSTPGSATGSGSGLPLDSAGPAPFTVPVGWTPVWWDEFDGSSLDTSKWNYDVGNGNWGWGNNETQFYTSSTPNVNQQAGVLNLVAQRGKSGTWTSGRINTLGKASFYPGMQTKDGSTYTTIHVEASILVPDGGQGLWPAFWMFPVQLTYGPWPASGEVDIMETINDMASAGGGLHYGGSPPNKVQDFQRFPTPNGKPYSSSFHTFGVDWSLNAISFYIDGKPRKTISAGNLGNGKAPAAGWWTVATGTSPSAPFDQPFYLILNLAVGGLWPKAPDATTPSPSTMAVDWVRVWAK